MSERKSVLKWTDCKYLHRLLGQSQQRLMEFACSGFKETGLKDDQQAIISLIELKNQILEVLDRLPKAKDFGKEE